MSEELLAEVRKAGRAAVAARAAAEQCQRLLEGDGDKGNGDKGNGDKGSALELIRALLPALDGLDRVVAASGAAPPAKAPLLMRLTGRLDRARELDALRDAIAMVRDQIAGALERAGVEIDREVGCPIDPERHRVVEARGSGGFVAEVVRPGYRIGSVRIRETDVAAR